MFRTSLSCAGFLFAASAAFGQAGATSQIQNTSLAAVTTAPTSVDVQRTAPADLSGHSTTGGTQNANNGSSASAGSGSSGDSGAGTGSAGTSGSSNGGASVGTSGTSGSASNGSASTSAGTSAGTSDDNGCGAGNGSSKNGGSSGSGASGNSGGSGPGSGSAGTSGSSNGGASAGTSGTSGSQSSNGDCIVPYCFGEGCPCGNDDPSAGCVNGTGVGALLSASGSTSVAADDLVLCVTDGVGTRFSFLCYGMTPDLVPFRDGLLCINSPLRLGIQQFNNGEVCYGPGLVAESCLGGPDTAGCIDAGETWYFQVAYRDKSDTSPCGLIVNFTNALKVTFTN